MFVVVWEFTADPAHRAAFERAYGPHGDWVQLFRRCDGYVATELLRDAENADRYVTLDNWLTPEQYVAGIASLGADYQALDARCESFTTNERRIGNFVAG